MAVNTDSIYAKYGAKRTGGASAPSKSTDSIYEKYGVKRTAQTTPAKDTTVPATAPNVTIPADTGKEEQDHVDAYLAEITGKANKATEETREGANPQYVASRLGTGVVKTAQGVGNALATIGQTLQKNQLAEQAQTVGAIGELTGNKTLQGGAKYMEQQSKKELEAPFAFGDKQAQKVADKYGEVSGFAKTAGDVAEGLGGMLPAIAIGLIPGMGSAAAMAITTSGAAGNAVAEAKAEGASDANAMAYGLAVGGVELATEKLLDGLGGVFGKGLGDDFVRGIIKKAVKNEGAQKALTGLMGALGEGFEEFIAEYAGALANKWLVGSDTRGLSQLTDDAKYSALIGALVGGLVQGGTMASKGMKPDANALANEASFKAEISPSEQLSSEPTTDTSEDGNAIRAIPGRATEASINGGSTNLDNLLAESEEQKQSRLSGAEIKITPAKEGSGEHFDRSMLSGVRIQDAGKYLTPILRKLGIFTKYQNPSLDVSFEYSANGMRRSASHQRDISGMEFNDFALVNANLKELCENAYPAEAHVDEKPPESDGHVQAAATLFSALRDGDRVIPVKMTVKFFDNRNPTLHVVVSGETANEGADVIAVGTQENAQHIAEGTLVDGISIADFLALVNGNTEFSKRIPSISNAQDKPKATGAAPIGFSENGEAGFAPTQSKGVTESTWMDELDQEIAAPAEHQVISEQQSITNAMQRFDLDKRGNITNFDEAVDDLLNQEHWNGSDADAAMILMRAASSRGEWGAMRSLARRYNALGTEVAQALQARQKWVMRDSPDHGLSDMVMQIERYAKQHKARGDAEIHIPDELLEKYRNATTDEERNAVVLEMQEAVAGQVKPTLLEKWNALRYTNMLGNFKTQVRNIFGNVANRALYSLKNEVATLMELALPAEQRTKSAYVGSEWMKAAKADYANAKRAINRYGKYTNDNNESEFISGIEDQRRIFDSPLEQYRKATNWAMTKGDELFSKGAYARALAGYLKAKGIEPVQLAAGAVDPALMEEARAYAVQQAQEVTFRDSNAVSDWVSKVGRRADTPKPVKAVAEGVAPFRRTPANVLVRAEEYSPLGLVNTAVKAVQSKKSDSDITASDVIDQLSKSLTGSAMFAIGWWLADNGLLRATGDDEAEDVDALMNRQDYSLIIPGVGSYTLDWLTPASLILFTGAELSEMLSDEGFTWADIEGAITSLADPLINMSMLSGVNDTLDNIKYSDSNIIQMAATSALSYLTQGLTNTLAGQIERIAEPERMSTYVDSENNIPDWLERGYGKATAKTPGIDRNQTEYLDEFGNTESNGGIGERIVESLFSPGYFSSGNEGRTAYAFAQEAYDTLGYNPAPDAYAPKELQEGDEKIKLDQADREQYQKVRGQAAEELLSAASSNRAYNSLDNDTKAKVLSKLKTQASDEAKVGVLGDNGVAVKQSATEKAIAALGAGDMVTYYSYWMDMETPAGYTSNPTWQKLQTISAMGFDEGSTMGLIEAVDADLYKKIRAAYDDGVPLGEILDYYEAVTARKPDGENKDAREKRFAVNDLEFSTPRNKAILNRIF